MRELNLYLDRVFVGKLVEKSSIWGFEYDADWLAKGFNIIPGLDRLISDSYQSDPDTNLLENLYTYGIQQIKLLEVCQF